MGGSTIESFISEVDRLRHEIRHGRKLPELVYRLHLFQENDEGGHVWVMHTHRNGTFDWYHSFTGQYNLEFWMNREKQHRPLDFAALKTRIQDLQTILSAKMWDDNTDAAYSRLFHVSLHRSQVFRDLTESSDKLPIE